LLDRDNRLPGHADAPLGRGGGFLFAALLLVIATSVVGGIKPALIAVALAAVAQILFFGTAFDPGASMPNIVSLVGFVIAGITLSILIARLARLAGEQAALRRVATLVAHNEVGSAIVHKEMSDLLRPLARSGDLQRREPGRHHAPRRGADGIAASGDAGCTRGATGGGIRRGHQGDRPAPSGRDHIDGPLRRAG
jgi:hypothetical protein